MEEILFYFLLSPLIAFAIFIILAFWFYVIRVSFMIIEDIFIKIIKK